MRILPAAAVFACKVTVTLPFFAHRRTLSIALPALAPDLQFAIPQGEKL
jgi:hypothetical protein